MKQLVLRLIHVVCGAIMRMRGCELGRGVVLNGLPYVRRKGSGKVVLGDRVQVNTARWANPLNTPGATVLNAEDGAILELKAGCGVSSSHLIANVGIEIGEGSLIGAGSLLCDSDMHEVPLGSDRGTAMAPILIGKRVFLGARCIVLKGVNIGDGSVVAAGSVVVSDIPAGVMAAGKPAKVIRSVAGPADPYSQS